jgi:hypothetical protein
MDRMNRRTFLAATAAPLLYLPRGARAASDRLSMGFIGTGGRGGDGLIRNFIVHSDCQCVAVCDPFVERQQKRAKQIEDFYTKREGKTFTGVAQYTDFREMLKRKDIDAVCIATPDHWHVPALVAAARAGKDVYVEKPLSPTIAENLLARKVIRETKRIFQYGTQQRGAEHVRKGCALVRSGVLGKIKAIEVVSPSGVPGGSRATAPVPAGFDWELWQGPAPAREFAPDRCVTPGHYHISDYSIGFLGGWGAHPLDVLDWCFATPTVPVEYEGSGLIPREGLFDTVMNWDVRCRYADGVEMRFLTGSDSTTFLGENGWIRIARNGIQSGPKSLTEGIDRTSFNNMGNNHARNFLESIRTRQEAESPIDSAIRSDLISHLSNIAVRLGRKVKWDPEKETIPKDAEALRMMEREWRKPWDVFV